MNKRTQTETQTRAHTNTNTKMSTNRKNKHTHTNTSTTTNTNKCKHKDKHAQSFAIHRHYAQPCSTMPGWKHQRHQQGTQGCKAWRQLRTETSQWWTLDDVSLNTQAEFCHSCYFSVVWAMGIMLFDLCSCISCTLKASRHTKQFGKLFFRNVQVKGIKRMLTAT